LKTAPPFSFPVSPALATKLAKLGIVRDADLVLHLPLRWEDDTRITPIRDLLPGRRRRCRRPCAKPMSPTVPAAC